MEAFQERSKLGTIERGVIAGLIAVGALIVALAYGSSSKKVEYGGTTYILNRPWISALAPILPSTLTIANQQETRKITFLGRRPIVERVRIEYPCGNGKTEYVEYTSDSTHAGIVNPGPRTDLDARQLSLGRVSGLECTVSRMIPIIPDLTPTYKVLEDATNTVLLCETLI